MKAAQMNGSSPQSTGAPRVHLHLLGSLEIIRHNEPIRLPTRKIEALLAYLALHPEAQAREKLAALFWGDVSDQQARVSLRYALGQLRKTLGGDVLRADREVAQLNPDFPIWIDAKEFQQIADRGGQNAATDLPIQTLKEAISRYRGDLLADFYDDWIFPEREHLRQLYLDALLQLTQQYRAQSQYVQAIETAQRVLESDPANERAHQHLIFCFVAQGNRQAALQQYENCVRALREELAIDPAPETTALYEWIKQTRDGSISPAARITNLPIPFTSFIGRGQEVAQIKAALTPNLFRTGTGEQVRLLTLTGAGGSGKTRLSIQAATDLIDAYDDGVWWVELAPLADDALVPRAVANALGVRESPQQPLLESLSNFLHEKQVLLVLDNCEHLLDACAQLARALLGECAKLSILATSREPLGFIGETVLGISTLAFPDPNATSLTDLLIEYEAVRLFVARAKAVNSRFELNMQNASAVAQICAHLDGIPLALELAAARVKELSVEEIAARLVDRFNFLTRGNRGALPRQQTLRALFDWSYDMLAEPERVLFRRLAVFAGGWELAAAAQVCAGDALDTRDVMELLSHLVDKSLVEKEVREETRYRMLETIRQYAQSKLVEANEEARIRQDHTLFFAEWVEQAESDIFSPRHAFWLNRLDAERDNLRAALEWAVKNNPLVALRIAKALGYYWELRSAWGEARLWYEQALSTTPDAPVKLRVYSLGWAAALGYRLGRKGDSSPFQQDSLDLARQSQDKALIAFALWHLNVQEPQRGTVLEEALALARETKSPYVLPGVLISLGEMCVATYDYGQAEAYFQEAAEIARTMYSPHAQAYSLLMSGYLAFLRGDMIRVRADLDAGLARARELQHNFYIAHFVELWGRVDLVDRDIASARAHLKHSLTMLQDSGTRRCLAHGLEGWARVALAQGETRRAARLLGAITADLKNLGLSLVPVEQGMYDQTLTAVQQHVDAASFQAEWIAGERLNLEQAIELALEAKE